MAACNPQIEFETIWGYTKEEIEHRWLVHQKFDVVNRFCGSSKGSDKETTVPPDNSANMLSALERILPTSDEDLSDEETEPVQE